jgi:hypothetical protein
MSQVGNWEAPERDPHPLLGLGTESPHCPPETPSLSHPQACPLVDSCATPLLALVMTMSQVPWGLQRRAI